MVKPSIRPGPADATPPRDPTPDVSVVVVSWNTARLLSAAIAAIPAAAGDLVVETIVVDNASRDDSVAAASARPDVTVTPLPENTGFTRAANLGVSLARGRHLLFLNPDLVMPPGTLPELVRALEQHPAAWAVTPAFLDPDGTVQHFWARRPTAVSLFCCFTHRGRALDRLLTGGRLRRRHRYEDLAPGVPLPIDGAGAACLLCRAAEFRDAGGFDERYFNFFQDTDLYRRMRARGRSLLGAGQVSVLHQRGVTFSLLDPVEAHGRFLRDLARYVEGEPRHRRLAARAALTLELAGTGRAPLRRWVRSPEVAPPQPAGGGGARGADQP